jgi:hypothetical protein
MPTLHPPFALPGSPARVSLPESREVTAGAPMPQIEEFLDELPLIDDFLLSPEAHAEVPAPVRAEPVSQPVQADEEGWAAADWQSYDWSGLASLGAPEPEAAAAHAEWASTSWDSTAGRFSVKSRRKPALPEDEVAAALDEMARRIRSGELSLQEFRGTPPEAAIAALFAAFLRNKG